MKFRAYLPAVWIPLLLLTLSGCQKDSNPAGPDNGNIVPPRQLIETISAQDAKALIDTHAGNSGFMIIDVRTSGEYGGGHIENAVNIDFTSREFETLIGQLDKSKTYLIYCASGNRSGQALAIMEDMDFQTVYNLSGGIGAWKAAGYPVV